MTKKIKVAKLTIAKQIVFPAPLYKLIETRLSQLGVSAPEYVRQLVIEDVKPLYKNIPMLNDETEEALGRSLKDYSEGKVTTLRNKKEIKEHFKRLSKEANK